MWRLQRPAYWGMVDASPLPVGRVLLEYERVDADEIEPVGRALGRLVDMLEPEYAANIHQPSSIPSAVVPGVRPRIEWNGQTAPTLRDLF